MAQQAPISSTRPLPKAKLTYAQFLEWLDEDTWAEWGDGEVGLISPVSRHYSETLVFLVSISQVYTSARGVGKVLTEPFQMKTGRDLPGCSPDILFVSAGTLHRLKPTYLDGPAKLVVGIVSPDSEERDRVTKFSEYQQGGVREY